MRFVIRIRQGKIPDVLEVEKFIQGMASSPATVEEYTRKLSKHVSGKCWKPVVTGFGSTMTHGEIEYEVKL